MALIALGALGHSPGTTTTAVALTLRWPRSAVLIEADTSTTSAVLAGRLRGQLPHRMGLTNLAGAAIHGELDPPLLWANSVPLDDDRRLVPGFASLGAAKGAGQFWPELLSVVAALDEAGSDIIIDLGRCDADDPRAPLLAAAHVVLITSGASLPDVASMTAPTDGRTTRLGAVADLLERVGQREVLRLVLIERPHDNYSAAEIRRVTGTPIAGSLPYAPDAAAVYSHGASVGSRKRLLRDAYERSITTLIAHTHEVIADRDRRLGARRGPAEEER